jgi:hypothetical protein
MPVSEQRPSRRVEEYAKQEVSEKQTELPNPAPIFPPDFPLPHFRPLHWFESYVRLHVSLTSQHHTIILSERGKKHLI